MSLRRLFALTQFSVASCWDIGNRLSIGDLRNTFAFRRLAAPDHSLRFSGAPMKPVKQIKANGNENGINGLPSETEVREKRGKKSGR